MCVASRCSRLRLQAAAAITLEYIRKRQAVHEQELAQQQAAEGVQAAEVAQETDAAEEPAKRKPGRPRKAATQ